MFGLSDTHTCMPFVTALYYTLYSNDDVAGPSQQHAVCRRTTTSMQQYSRPLHARPATARRHHAVAPANDASRLFPLPCVHRQHAVVLSRLIRTPCIDSADAGRSGGGGGSSFPPTARPRGLVRVRVKVMVMVMVRVRVRVRARARARARVISARATTAAVSAPGSGVDARRASSA